jgi:hypothetical protein
VAALVLAAPESATELADAVIALRKAKASDAAVSGDLASVLEFRRHHLAEIASEGVVVEMVDRIFGSTAAPFGATAEALLAGGPSRAQILVREQPAIRAIPEGPEPPKQVSSHVATEPGIHRRAGPCCAPSAIPAGPIPAPAAVA